MTQIKIKIRSTLRSCNVNQLVEIARACHTPASLHILPSGTSHYDAFCLALTSDISHSAGVMGLCCTVDAGLPVLSASCSIFYFH